MKYSKVGQKPPKEILDLPRVVGSKFALVIVRCTTA